ncbi:MAG: endopeptidase La [Lachnospiraceae bacterium]|nr:endopeptidase La [Lachnospiraceae bacterium]
MTRVLPMLALRDKMIYPKSTIHFDVSRKKSIAAIEEAMQNDQMIFLSNQIDAGIENPAPADLYEVGLVAKIKQVVKLPQNIVRVFVEGIERAEIIEICETEPSFRVETKKIETIKEFEIYQEEAYIESVKNGLRAYHAQNPQLNREFVSKTLRIQDLENLIDEIATHLPFSLEKKQEILELSDLQERSQRMLVVLTEECEIARVQKEIQVKVKAAVDKSQRDYMLREQLQVIREELGETSIEEDADIFLAKAKELDASDEVKEKIIKEINRFKSMPAMAGDSGMLRNYIETMLEMPWNKRKDENHDLKQAAKILEEDHYGLEKIKERIMEFLAVRTLTNKGEAPIICLVGPPGTGKTSIAKSIARALSKEYVRISLGGVRDEAEIRGHRKTYIGAMPGRIAEAIKKAGVANPLILLDEIDKTGKDQRGDTASALLEVLDGEQNVNFRDHYLEVALDLSEVLFLATANDASMIPKPLYDRMEIIEVSSYTENEKFHIAEQYLIKKQQIANGLTDRQVRFRKEGVWEIIRNYTREAGVRSLEHKIGDICRKSARFLLEKEKDHVTITKKRVREMLGTAPYAEEKEELSPQCGIVRGLAWTSVGGTTLPIEVNTMPGKGKLQLTGNLGDVMKESAQIAISYVRSISESYDIPEDYFEKHDLHIHVPEGAVPKDGPSAGITMTTAILSAVTGKEVRGDIAMTGEVTLRGNVLPIGGLKEKLLAAKNAGAKEVFIPRKNKKNVKDINREITDGLTITYASHMTEVINGAFV